MSSQPLILPCMVGQADAGGGDDAVNSAGTYALPPWIYPPPEAEPIDLINYVNLPAIGVSAAILRLQIEPGYNAVILMEANNFIGGGWTEGSGAVTWSITRDGAPVPGYDLIVASLGSPANPTRHPSGFRVKENSVLQLNVTNVSVVLAGQLSGGRLAGWYYPKEYENPFSQGR
jgi:hypothetical protein